MQRGQRLYTCCASSENNVGSARQPGIHNVKNAACKCLHYRLPVLPFPGSSATIQAVVGGTVIERFRVAGAVVVAGLVE
jgi:hypothetical protein